MVRYLLAVSLLANVAAAAGFLLLVARRGGLPWLLVRLRLRPAPAPDYAALAAERFGDQDEPGGTIWWGDSIAQNAPLLRMLADTRQWGIGGQTIAQLRTWLPQVVAARPSRVVVSAGTNDLGTGRAADVTGADLRRLLDDLEASLPGCDVRAVAVPPIAGREADAGEVNAAVADRPIAPWPGLPDGWTDDGCHPSRAAYLACQVAG